MEPDLGSQMTATTTSIRTLIRCARDGDRDALGRLLEHHRPYLKLLARRMIGERLSRRLDESDIVQQTCLSVFGRIEEFEGHDPDQFVAWLRTIHEHNLKNVLRDHVSVQKRSVDREQTTEIGNLVGERAPAQQSSPSQRLMQGERAVRLAAALQKLEPDQREAVRLRYLEGWSLAQISEHTGRTKHSIAGLIKRGLSGLRKELRDERH
jgi:RNA polymerase sigma-70 factor (ECF subfamily)